MRRLRRVLDLLRHPGRLLRRWKEARRAAAQPPVRSDIPVDRLPPVTLLPVESGRRTFDEALRLFADNPSPLNASPRSPDQLRRTMEKGTRYWLVRDDQGRIVGGLGLETWRSMVVHVTVDAGSRSRGLGLAMVRALHQWMRQEGFTEVRAQVLKQNSRALSLFLSLGYLPLDRPGRRYQELVRSLQPPRN